MNIESVSATRMNIMKKIIKMITVITLETVFKIGAIAVFTTKNTRNTDVIIPTTQGFMISDSVIKALSIFWFIMNIGSFQAPL